MSLVRLLTAGRSLIGIKDSTSRYQMRSRHLLPKFGAEKNPFAVPPAPVTAPAPTAPTVASPASTREKSPAEIAAARLKDTKRLPTRAFTEAKPVARLSSFLARARSWFSQWLQKLKRREPGLPRKPALKAALVRFGKPAVQGELSLDRIKVVRNDLSDADVEMVPARPEAKARSRPAAGRIELAGTPTT